MKWKIADLVWILVGGASTFVAFYLSTVLSDVERTQRETDNLRMKAEILHSDADLFVAQHCSPQGLSNYLLTAMGELESICGSAAQFRDLTAEEGILYSSLIWILGGDQLPALPWSKWPSTEDPDDSILSIMKQLEDVILSEDSNRPAIPPLSSSIWSSFDGGPGDPVDSLLSTGFHIEVALEYAQLRERTESIRREINDFRPEIQTAIDKRRYAALQIIAISLVFLTLPLRVGKSINDIFAGAG